MTDPPEAGVRTLRGFLRKRRWRGPQGPVQRAVRDAIRDLVSPSGTVEFTLQEIMEKAGLDPNSYKDHLAASRFISKMRTVVADFADYFWTQPEYAKDIERGLSDKQLFGRLVYAMSTFGIYPLWYDSMRREKYILLPLEGYSRIIHQRGLSIRNEMERLATELHLLQRKFPMLAAIYQPPALTTDGKLLSLPTSERFKCEVCEMRWASASALQRHVVRRHPEKLAARAEEDRS